MLLKRTIRLGFCLLLFILAPGCSADEWGPLTEGLQPDVDLSPDDQTLLFSYAFDQTAAVYTADLHGKHIKRLTPSSDSSFVQPVFSPDGRKIAMIRKRGNNEQILCIMNRDGSGLKALTDKLDGLVTDLAFSRDGRYLYFAKAYDLSVDTESPVLYHIFRIHPDGTGLEMVTRQKEYELRSLAVSADDQTLYYVTGQTDDDDLPRLKVVPIAHPEKAHFLVPKGKREDPSVNDVELSPSGNWLVFTGIAEIKDGLPKYEQYLMNMKTKETKRISFLRSETGSAVFFHKKNQVLFTEDINWNRTGPDSPPPEYKVWITDFSGLHQKSIPLHVPLPER
ncbi:PD40 domain-containing protein [Thermoactinomyces sp. CICC 10522]|uniref:TolB family protein n=1 Tax=Thermoactinomyces sp. CICC 10522 TaxID=2767427 RepID=UPI0018DE0937|nr:PD40 domain-containing protein [Thermoactinomyces sp. CICC 10522]MBH8603872.1 PD40 domain-containing protein [Thermoactinomyces sp. CICC 10522]